MADEEEPTSPVYWGAVHKDDSTPGGYEHRFPEYMEEGGKYAGSSEDCSPTENKRRRQAFLKQFEGAVILLASNIASWYDD